MQSKVKSGGNDEEARLACDRDGGSEPPSPIGRHYRALCDRNNQKTINHRGTEKNRKKHKKSIVSQRVFRFSLCLCVSVVNGFMVFCNS
jgi:hypothetical protein